MQRAESISCTLAIAMHERLGAPVDDLVRGLLDGVQADFCRWAGACHGLLLIVNKFDFLVGTSMAPWVKFIDP